MISILNKLVDWFIAVNWYNILVVVLAPMGVLLGIFINEYFRRKNLASLHSEKIFSKKLEIYEKLHKKMNEAYTIGMEIIEDKKLSKDEEKNRWTGVVLSLAKYLDDNNLYINEMVSAHCAVTVVGVEDIKYLKDEEKKAAINKFSRDCNEAMNLIKEDSGLKRLDNFFSKINKPKLSSSWIKYIEDESKKRKKEKD